MDINEHNELSKKICRQINKMYASIAESAGYDQLNSDRNSFIIGSMQMLLAQLAIDIPEVMERLKLAGLVEQCDINKQDEEFLEIPRFLRRQAE